MPGRKADPNARRAAMPVVVVGGGYVAGLGSGCSPRLLSRWCCWSIVLAGGRIPTVRYSSGLGRLPTSREVGGDHVGLEPRLHRDARPASGAATGISTTATHPLLEARRIQAICHDAHPRLEAQSAGSLPYL
jgi:hypothetical protein